MSKLESLGKFLILTERCVPEKVVEVVDMVDKLGGEWCKGVSTYKNKEPIMSVLKQVNSISLTFRGGKPIIKHSQERFYRENPEYCGGNFLSAEYFLFLAEDHLYEKQAGGGASK